jgi:hypothetical protein
MLVDEAIKRVDSEIGDSRGYSNDCLDGEQPKTSLYATLHGGKEFALKQCWCRVSGVQKYARNTDHKIASVQQCWCSLDCAKVYKKYRPQNYKEESTMQGPDLGVIITDICPLWIRRNCGFLSSKGFIVGFLALKDSL